ncbi:MAG: hypothetical protein LQ351_001190 [Letrouitia transgressa]|nr:MAG: hypothetical protein LQ351_001190 [Letrouitia transgressa]
MQSFLQYRRFGRHIKAQYERDCAKAEELKRQDEQGSQSVSPITSSPPSASPIPSHTLNEASTGDLEKGEPSGATSGNNTSNTDLTPQLLNNSNYNLNKLSQTRAASRQSMLRTIGTALAKTLTGVDTKPGERGQKIFVVGYEGEKDAMNPHNWGFAPRIGATINIAWIGWIVGFASSVDSAALKQASADFGVSDVTESLATGLFLIGFGIGE